MDGFVEGKWFEVSAPLHPVVVAGANAFVTSCVESGPFLCLLLVTLREVHGVRMPLRELLEN